MRALPAPTTAVRTTCPYCGVGCGILAVPDGRGGATIGGDPQHPANFGRLCSKGAALGETLSLETRLLHPMLRQTDGKLARADWNSALDRVADTLRGIIAREGPDAVAFYLSGQLLTEDYYVANKLMKGFIGSANVDTNSRLCMASSVAGHRRAFGTDTVPGIYADLDAAELIVLVGSNAAWCHPVLFQRMLRNRQERGAKLVVIDPRRTATADEADLFLPITPGMDTALFCGLLVHLADAGALDRDYIAAHTTGFEPALARARSIAREHASKPQTMGASPRDMAQFFALFAACSRVVTCFSQGVNQSAQGTDKVNAIINCHLATGRIGKPGTGPFSLTGQPNAMGGREVGGLANQLAAHMNFTPPEIDRVRRFWTAPRMAEREGLKAVGMFDAIADGRIKALWVMGTNPAVSLPRAGAARDALKRLALLVISENVLSNDTVAAGPHVLLPAAAWGEKNGTVTNSERRISRQRPFLPLPGEARPDWWMVSEVARRLGYGSAFAYDSAAAIHREHAALSAFENGGTRDFDLAALATLGDAAYDALEPVMWPAPSPSAEKGEERFFAGGGFFTPDRKARFVAPEMPAIKSRTSESFPLRLNTGRVRDQWHTMTRTGLSPRLGAHRPEPFVEVHPDDAAAFGLADGGFARVTTLYGACDLKVVIDTGQQRGSLFVPIHWSHQTASAARVGDLVGPFTDPFSGQPEAKATAAAIAPLDLPLRGFALARRPLAWPDGIWWSRVAVGGGCGYRIALPEAICWFEAVRAQFAGCAIAEYEDPRRGVHRVAAFSDDRLVGCTFVGPNGDAPAWDVAKALFESEALQGIERRALLSGRSAAAIPDRGRLVCACFAVGLNALRDAILSQAAVSVDDVGRILHAGTNCGSCIPELKRIIADAQAAQAC